MNKYRYSKDNNSGFWCVFDRETDSYICKVWAVKRSGRYKWRAGRDGIVERGNTRDLAVEDYLITKEWTEKMTTKR